MEGVFAGIKNMSGVSRKAMYGGKVLQFDKDEVKVLPEDAVNFLLGRSTYISDGKLLSRKMLFGAIELHDALKVAKSPENPSVAAAKAKMAQDEVHSGELRVQILKTLKEEGWTPPKAKA